MTTVGIVGIICVLIYSAVLIGISVRTAMHKELIDTGKKFYLGNGTRHFVLLFSMLASCFSTWVIMGAPVTTYRQGHTWIALVTMYQMTLSFTIGYLGPRFWILAKKFGYMTHSDLVAHYFGKNAIRYLIGAGFVLGWMSTTVAQFKAMGTSISAMTGGAIPYWAASLFLAVVIGIYIFIGGFHGTALVDTVQGLLFSIILFGGLAVMLITVGGFPNMFDLVAAEDTRLVLYGTGPDSLWPPKTAITFCVVGIFGGMLTPGFWQRYYAADKPKTLVKMSIWFPILTSIGVSTTGGLVGLAAHAFPNVDVGNADAVFQDLLSAISTPYWAVIVVIGVLAAGMSTVAGNMNGAALVVSYDFVRNMHKGTPDHTLRNVGRVSSLVIMGLVYLFSLYTFDAVTALVQLSTAFYAVALFPVLTIFIWKRGTYAGCMAGMIGCLGGVVVTNFIWKDPLGIMAGFWGLMIGLALYIVVSLCTKPVPAERRAEFMAPLKAARVRPQTHVD